MVISQTSQALNLCNSTLEFMGSTEQVEAEKLLLLASKWNTCINILVLKVRSKSVKSAHAHLQYNVVYTIYILIKELLHILPFYQHFFINIKKFVFSDFYSQLIADKHAYTKFSALKLKAL